MLIAGLKDTGPDVSNPTPIPIEYRNAGIGSDS